jgi:hypothetical protein
MGFVVLAFAAWINDAGTSSETGDLYLSKC